MLSKEYRTIAVGSAVVVLVAALLNLVLKFGTALSLSLAIISGVIVGLIINKSKGR